MDLVDLDWATAGRRAVASLDLGCVKAFLEAGLDIKVRGHEALSFIHEAIENPNLQVLEYLLLQAGGRSIIDAQDSHGWTALGHAIEGESWEVARLLVRHGANLDMEHWHGIIPDDKLQELSMESASSRRECGESLEESLERVPASEG